MTKKMETDEIVQTKKKKQTTIWYAEGDAHIETGNKCVSIIIYVFITPQLNQCVPEVKRNG